MIVVSNDNRVMIDADFCKAAWLNDETPSGGGYILYALIVVEGCEPYYHTFNLGVFSDHDSAIEALNILVQSKYETTIDLGDIKEVGRR